MLKGAGVSAARVVSCLLCVHYLFVRIASTVSVILVPAEPSLPNSCLLRACVGTARFHHGCSSRPATNASYFSRTHAHFRTDAPSCVRAPLRADALLVRTPPRARACFPARVFCVRACFPARVFCVRACFPACVFLRARVLLCARFCCVRACFSAPVFPARASSVCVRLFYHTACGRAHAECAPRFCILTQYRRLVRKVTYPCH